ncbi:MAG: hypothetical protein LIP02_03950 [Bacteroidales bacterium]|nr:hypothetical protein [Bacteroidales bacterium]
MKSKIFAKLKQEYASLGLGDEALLARAESLSATGLVTDENIDAVVAVQRGDLESIQRRMDKRVADALEKARKTREDEDKAKAEAEAKAKAEAEEKAEAERKAKEEAERKAREGEEALKAAQTQTQIPAGNDPNDRRIAALEKQIKDILDAAKRKDEDAAKSQKKLSEANADLLKRIEAITKESEEAKAAQARADFDRKITEKAKMLGVPQWRIDEGFTIAQDASDETIAMTLEKVANNITANLLPSPGGLPPIADGKPAKSEVDAIAASLVK